MLLSQATATDASGLVALTISARTGQATGIAGVHGWRDSNAVVTDAPRVSLTNIIDRLGSAVTVTLREPEEGGGIGNMEQRRNRALAFMPGRVSYLPVKPGSNCSVVYFSGVANTVQRGIMVWYEYA